MEKKTHPLALKTTELIWEGKYGAEGKRVAPLRVALPFQTVETVNESTQERQKNLLFGSSASQETEWRNRLIWGDKKYVLPSLLPEFAHQRAKHDRTEGVSRHLKELLPSGRVLLRGAASTCRKRV